MMHATMGNPNHPEYGVMTAPFPILDGQYSYVLDMLSMLEIGETRKADCKVEKIDSMWPVLKRPENQLVDVDELNYLAKRLESFDIYEATKFSSIAEARNYTSVKDLINLTFCCQQVTVITDFSDLAAVGRNHYMVLHGGCAKTEALDTLDGEKTARLLIESGSGIITPYGVVYDNGMQLEQLYSGQNFPGCYYRQNVLTLAAMPKSDPIDSEDITCLYLPMPQEEIERMLLRADITDPTEVHLRLDESCLPDEATVLLDMEKESIADLNALAAVVNDFPEDSIEKLGAVVSMTKPKNTEQVRNLAENIDLFDFAPGVHTPEEYGKYMIQQSGRFEYDEALSEFYDYGKYGVQRMNAEDGMFIDRGYVSYRGCISMTEVMDGSPSNRIDVQMESPV